MAFSIGTKLPTHGKLNDIYVGTARILSSLRKL